MSGKRQIALGAKKYFLIPLILVPLSIFVMNSLNAYLSNEIQPYAFAFISVEGGPDSGAYVFSFALVNQNGTNGPANGYITLKITGAGGGEAYRSTFRVKAEDFRYISVDGYPKLATYTWAVQAKSLNSSNVSGRGIAEITFLSLYGNSVSGTLEVQLP